MCVLNTCVNTRVPNESKVLRKRGIRKSASRVKTYADYDLVKL